jgi:RHS repeat-associated protein
MRLAISCHVALKALSVFMLMSSLLVQGHAVASAAASPPEGSPGEGPGKMVSAGNNEDAISVGVGARHWHSAAILKDGGVLLRNGTISTRFTIEAKRVRIIDLDAHPKTVLVSQRVARAAEVASDGVVALRSAQPLAQGVFNDQTITLTGPTGPAQIQVLLSDDKRHAVIIPKAQLFPGSPYTLFIQSVGETRIAQRPFLAIPLKTIAIKAQPELLALAANGAQSQPSDIVDDEDWVPTMQHRGGHWRSGLPFPHKTSKLRKGQRTTYTGETALKGQVLRLNGMPLSDVTVRIGNVVTKTDQSGSFVLKGLQNGHNHMIVDGRTATRDGKKYSFYEIGVDIKAGILNELGYAIWLPKLRNKDVTHIPSPTTQEVVITHPDIPGLEVHIPPQTVIRDQEGNVVTEVAITPVPLDKAPFPVPENFPVYFMISPGGAVVQSLDPLHSPGIQIVYPNYTGHKPGSRVSFWVYAHGNWFVYGHGRISPDGQSVYPDHGVGLHEHMAGGHLLEGGDQPAEPEPKDCGGCTCAGDPVDCKTGLFVLPRTDFNLRDVFPLEFTRTYRPGDTVVRPFGFGTTHPYAMYLYNPNPSNPDFDVIKLVLPDSSLITFERIPGVGTDLHSWAWEHKAIPSRFYGAKLQAKYWETQFSGERWVLTLKDGTVYEFSEAGGNALIAMTDRFGNRLTIVRNAGLVTRLSTPNGRYVEFTYDMSNRITQAEDIIGRIWTYQYDANGMLQRVTYPDTTYEEYTYDTSGRMLTVKDRRGNIMVTNQYDPTTGRVTQQTLAAGSPAQAVYQFVYTTDGSGNVTQTDVTDPRGNVRRTTFHSSGYAATIIHAYGTPQAQTITYVRDTSGLPLSVTDALGRKTTYTYDAKGNILTITRLADTSEAVTETFMYTSDYNQIATQTDGLNHTTTFNYDTLGRLTAITNPLTQQVTFTYNPAGQPVTITDALNHTTTFGYDLGDLRSVTDPLNRVTTSFTDEVGHVTSMTDSLGRRTNFEYSNVDRLTKITDALKKITEFTYDGNGNLLTVKDSKNQTSAFGYDVRNRRTSRTDPLLRVESVSYDGMGNVTGMTDRKSQTTSYQFDALNRRTLATYHGGTTSTTYTYDAGDRLTQMVDSVSGTITRTYDNLGRLTNETTPQGGISYNYDNANRRVSMTVAGQPTVTYNYDNADRLTSVTQASSSVGVAYDAASRATQVTLQNNLAIVYGYDNANQLTSLTYQQGATTLGTLTYAYDNAGRRTSVGGTWARTGLPVVASAGSITLNANNQVLTFDGSTMTYDLNGNLATVQDAVGTGTYTWDVRDRLTSLTAPGFAASFSYDALGRRTGKTVQGATTNFVYDGLNPVQEKNGAIVTANLLTGLGIDQIFTRTDGVGTQELFTDALGSTVALADTAGAVQTSYTYEPFGGTTQSGSANTNSYKYTGREDDGTGLYYYRARYYSPRLQRFLSEDPIGLLGGDVNLYAYVGGNPISRTDPNGLYWFQQPWQAINPIVGREGTFIEPGGPISSFIEKYVPAGRTLAEIHDPLVESLTKAGIRDSIANIPTMPFAYLAAIQLEILRSLRLAPQPTPPCRP